ncbi:cytochrome C oxidase subunit IV family protein [Pontibaca methylaminivorans]|uniref:cytochrome C oxidase subunit IV family protein n=1 Tax=Pontibaca methylaminivorans TaxID=515897 RepID=UPI002FDAC8A9
MSAPRETGRPWRRAALVWIALMAFLAATVIGAYGPGGEAVKLLLALGIAAVKAGIVILLFMESGRAGGAARIAGLSGLLWVVLLIALSMTDRGARQQLPPGFGDDRGIQDPGPRRW